MKTIAKILFNKYHFLRNERELKYLNPIWCKRFKFWSIFFVCEKVTLSSWRTRVSISTQAYQPRQLQYYTHLTSPFLGWVHLKNTFQFQYRNVSWPISFQLILIMDNSQFSISIPVSFCFLSNMNLTPFLRCEQLPHQSEKVRDCKIELSSTYQEMEFFDMLYFMGWSRRRWEDDRDSFQGKSICWRLTKSKSVFKGMWL